jgi:hypothetical protein
MDREQIRARAEAATPAVEFIRHEPGCAQVSWAFLVLESHRPDEMPACSCARAALIACIADVPDLLTAIDELEAEKAQLEKLIRILDETMRVELKKVLHPGGGGWIGPLEMDDEPELTALLKKIVEPCETVRAVE